jgi:AAA domain, putative AbiEii toxin, Type IV TA system
MRIKSFSYKEDSWEINNLNLGSINLLVGQNGTGKSRTLSKIDRFVKILTQQEKNFETEEWIVEFVTSDNHILRYELKTLKSKNEVVKEVLFYDEEIILDRKRKDSSFKIRTNANSEWETYSPPARKLAISSINDIIKYPQTAKILNWAENSYGFEFSFSSKFVSFREELLNETGNVADLFDQLNKKQQSTVIENLNLLGFKIDDIEIKRFSNSGKPFFLLIDERQLKYSIYHDDLSQGMARTLSLIIYLEFLISRKNPATIVIDDFGEGLDYIRARELGKLAFQKCLNKKIQLIATTNDSFLMDAIDINNWNILKRDGKVVTSFNKQNHPELFENFKFTGLSNFDFFSSDYIDSHL